MLSLLHRGRRTALALAAALASTSLGCGDGPTGPRIGDIIVEPSELTLRQKEAHRLIVTVTDPDGALVSGVVVGFKSLNEGLVTVSSIGEITSVGPAGATKVRLTAAGFTKDIPVIVEGIPTSVRITPSPATLVQKGTLALRAKLLDVVEGEIAGAPMTYLSSDTRLITVDPAGVVTSVGPHGKASIQARSGTLSAITEVTVTQVVSGMQVAPSSMVLGTAQSARIRAYLVDLLGVEMGGGTFTFASSNPAVVTVDGEGMARAVGPLGETTITVKSGTYTKTLVVRVVESAHPVGEKVGTISLAGAFGVAFTRAGIPYAVSIGDGVYRIDIDARSATKVVTGTSGLDLALTAAGTRAYVANQAWSRVDLVDLAAGTVLQSSPRLDDGALTDLLSADDQTLWVGTGQGIVVLDASTLAVLHTISTGAVIHLARHPTQPYLYASGNRSTVTEIDVNTRTVRRTLSVGGWTQGVVVSHDGSELYAADEGGPVRVVNLASGAISGSISLESSFGSGYGIALSPDGLRLYVTMSGSNKLAIIDPAARSMVGTIDIPGRPRRLALNSSGTVLLVAAESGTVTIIQ